MSSPARSGWQLLRRASGQRWVFYTGAIMVTIGVAFHVPMFVESAAMHYQMNGMGTPPLMLAGMSLIVVGLVVAVWGILPVSAWRPQRSRTKQTITLMSGAPLTTAQNRLMATLFFAMVVDQMKPATLAFIEPGMRAEYGISAATVSELPVIALSGTVVGSLLWGLLADRVGRRPTVLVGALMFAATTICSTMPTFAWNLSMCFLMGMSAGGMLPITYTLLAEAIPPDRRGLMMLLQAGLSTVAGYLLCSGLATIFLPVFGWRIMWLLQLPLVIGLLIGNRWIPESPGFLIAHGREREAVAIAASYNATLSAKEPDPGLRHESALSLLTPGYRLQTVILVTYALSWSFVYWGFMTFLPTLLRTALGPSSNKIIFFSALLAIPGTALVAYCYHRWGSRMAMTLFGLVTALALIGLAFARAGGGVPVAVAVIFLLAGASGVLATIGPYAAEIYPTSFRGAATGLTAAFSKAGGMFGPPLVALLLSAFPGITVSAIAAAVPMGVSAIAVAALGVNTRADLIPEWQLQAARR